ncbi:isochorismatase family protein [Methylomonas paludis]|nr:isochorismatase family protein [Methylomonas paludis]
MADPMIHPNLLNPANSVLVVVDLQARLSAAMPVEEAQLVSANSCRLLTAAGMLGIPVLVTEQYPRGLGPTSAEILAQLPAASPVYAKTGFSCCAVDEFNQTLESSRRSQVLLIGQEAHVCVLQTALALLQRGYQVYVVEDAVCSRQFAHKTNALQRIQQHGATIINHESVLFEWLGDAGHADFKAISALLRK